MFEAICGEGNLEIYTSLCMYVYLYVYVQVDWKNSGGAMIMREKVKKRKKNLKNQASEAAYFVLFYVAALWPHSLVPTNLHFPHLFPHFSHRLSRTSCSYVSTCKF